MSEDISCEEVRSRLKKGDAFLFIDVREEWEHDEQNIGAQCYPLSDLPHKLEELGPYKHQEIIVHCKTGPRGNRAKKYLSSQGFSNVRNMTGGIMAFLDLGTTQ